MSRHGLLVETTIQASAERVWSILTDFDAYPEWNPFIRWVRGEPRVDARLEARIQPSGARGMTFRPTVLVANPNRELRWLGRILFPGVFDGEHRFVIQPIGQDTVLFQQSEQFRGVLVPLLRSSLDRDTRRGFAEMNAALKVRSEDS